MSQWFTTASNNKPIVFLIASLLLPAAMSAPAAAEDFLSRSPERGGIGLAREQTPPPMPPVLRRPDLNNLDERLSILVTDKVTTSSIKFSDVMQKLADDLKVDRLTLFRRWWDTANDRKNSATDVSADLLCDSEGESSGGRLSTKNGFLYECPRAEGRQASLDPFTDEGSEAGYTAIAFSNRFDLADQNSGQHCGEYRIAFARNSGIANGNDRNLIIFEALVPNPDPPNSPKTSTQDNLYVNLKGCKPIVEFWRKLSDPMSTAARGKALKEFFIEGLRANEIAPGVPARDIGPVVAAKHYAGGPKSGQIRTNQFMKGRGPYSTGDWLLREFKIDCSSIVPATAKTNPGNSLFATKGDHRRLGFAEYLAEDALNNLRGGVDKTGKAENERNVDTFGFALTTVPLDHLNSFEGDQRLENVGDVVKRFNQNGRNGPVDQEVTEALPASSLLTTDNIIHRIRTQTCAGCHHYSVGDKELGFDSKVLPAGWPSTLGFSAEACSASPVSTSPLSTSCKGFTHVTERETEIGEDAKLPPAEPFNDLNKLRSTRLSHLSFKGPDGSGSRYKISDALKFLFLPQRYKVMVDFLNEVEQSP